MRVRDAIEHEQQRRTFSPVQQLFKHGVTPDLAGTDIGHHALMDAFDPSIHFTAFAVADTHLRFRGQVDQRLHAWIVAPFGQPNLLDPLRMMAKQSFYGV